MTEERMGEIALAYIRYKRDLDGFKVSSNTRRELGNVLKALNKANPDLHINNDEVFEFVETLVVEGINNAFKSAK